MNDTANKNGVKRTALVVAVVACLVGASLLGARAYTAAIAAPQITSVYNEEGVVPAADKASVDFDALASQNSDIRAWLYEPTLGINVPVVKSQAKKGFYRTHDAMGVKSSEGAVFFSQYNAADMSDAVTVLNVSEKSQVGEELLSFGNATTFAEAEPLRLYTPGYVRTYAVVAAYRDDDQDILEKHNYFASYDDLAAFEKTLKDPDSVSRNVNAEYPLDDSSKFLVLSTYQADALASGHFVVCGVLVDESAI